MAFAAAMLPSLMARFYMLNSLMVPTKMITVASYTNFDV